MEYIRIQSIQDPLFQRMHELMGNVFPPEEVLAADKWKEPLEDEGIHVYAAVLDGEVVGATEYRYYPDMRVAMTDFTIIGRPNSGIGRFLLRKREKDIARLASASGTVAIGMFAEIYNPQQVDYGFGGVAAMNPYVRREVLSHIGYQRLDFAYVHPSWEENGEAVEGLDLCFLPEDETMTALPASLVTTFLERYYTALPNKPAAWHEMIALLKREQSIKLKPI
ncbi:GNAT family N-acetyltransferase [Paenibacillus oenotherae]|uniref:GNAT family N-acetyltransferase n=1 Tax=Paenibacillus oenotherae TaxID=1435645 RepID=A0ABS7DD64_9BACL|nr:GNAT family N-acetyltransferase [Paenibacillus oenotherae]MBW7477591.1 GNAT family N-acetyltransferase [Paenibacillus oenotherae]